jgi:hypothetical protein
MFKDRSADGKKRYRDFGREMVRFAQSYAVPIMIAPPPTIIGGVINGGTGSIVKWNGQYVVLTASHILDKYEERTCEGEKLSWHVGHLRFDPLSRISWRDRSADTLLLSLSEEEALKTGSPIVSAPMEMPIPKEDQRVSLAGYPKALREVMDDVIGADYLAAMFRVTDIRCHDSCCYFDCKIDEREEDLVSFNGLSLPAVDMDMGGLSGGPTFLVAGESIIFQVLVGVVSRFVSQSFTGFRHLRIASLINVKV